MSRTPGSVYIVERVELAVGVQPEDGKIVDIGPYRHYVVWAGEKTKSSVSYCNACGSPFMRRWFRAWDDKPGFVCGGCRVFCGWEPGKC